MSAPTQPPEQCSDGIVEGCSKLSVLSVDSSCGDSASSVERSFAPCSVCHRQIFVRNDGMIRVHCPVSARV